MKRSTAIDILRAIAVVLVLGRHMDGCPERVSPLLHWLTGKWETGGWIGVDLFFVLSGFLVSGLLFREHEKCGAISAKDFLVRRGFKIYPSFWLFMMIPLSVFIFRRDHFKPLAVKNEFLFVQNYLPGIWGHTWSLAVEEHFYFFLAIFLFALWKLRGGTHPFRVVPTLFFALAIICLAARLITAHLLPQFDDRTHFNPTHLRIDSLFCGVFISYFYHTYPEKFMAWARRWRWVLLPMGLAMLTPAFCFVLKKTPWIYTYGLTLFYVGSACLLVSMLAIKIPDRALPKAIAFVGSHSYSIYLWHVVIMVWAVPLLAGPVKAERNWFVYFATYVFGSIAFGIAMSMLVEFPMLRLRDRWFPSRGRPLSAG